MLKEWISTDSWERVDSLCEPDGSGWKVDLIKKICIEVSANAILGMHQPVRLEEDWLCWCGNENGIF